MCSCPGEAARTGSLSSYRFPLRRSAAHLYSTTYPTVLAVVLDQLLDNAVRFTAENGVITFADGIKVEKELCIG